MDSVTYCTKSDEHFCELCTVGLKVSCSIGCCDFKYANSIHMSELRDQAMNRDCPHKMGQVEFHTFLHQRFSVVLYALNVPETQIFCL